MFKSLKFGASVAAFATLVVASTAVDATQQGVRGISSFYSMPPQGFHGVPRGFHGAFPRGSGSPTILGRQPVGIGHDLGLFHGRDYANFTEADREAWREGVWRHTRHDGHYGWWWFVDDDWFFYPAPIYPWPLYVGPDYYYDYIDEFGAPPYYWYHCEDPAGYYPYIQDCNGEWQAVPPTPDAR